MGTTKRIGKGRRTMGSALPLAFLLICLSAGSVAAQDKPTPQERAAMQDFYLTFNTEALWAQSSFRNMGFGFKTGTMKHVGWYISAMSNFQFNGAFSTQVPNSYNPDITSKSYLDGLVGMSFRVWKPVTWQIGTGFSYRTFNHRTFYYDARQFHLKDEVEMGPMLATGFMFDDMSGFLLSAEWAASYDINHRKDNGYSFKDRLSMGFKVGIGFSLQTAEGRRQLLEHYGYVLPETGSGYELPQTGAEATAPKTSPESAPAAERPATPDETPSEKSAVTVPAQQEEVAAAVSEPAPVANDTVKRADALATPEIHLPSVETSNPISITENSAMARGKIEQDGGELTERGFCFGKTPDPSLGDAVCIKVQNDGQKHFNATLERLTPSTHYYVRAYAINTAGVSYGEQVEFTTKAEIPSVETLQPEGMTATSVLCGGEIHAERYVGKTVEGRGVCYDTVPNPTVFSSHSSDGSGTGKFISTLSNLKPGTVYYVRAYAEHANGVDYGDNQSFRTRAALATTAAYNITDTSVMTGGYDLYDRGGVKVREKGVCCSYRPNPTVDNYRVITASWDVQNDSWKSILSGLEPNTDFHIRAYVILDNDAVLYGNDQSFRTKPACGQFTVRDVDGNEYHTVKIGVQCWMQENLRTTRYADGSTIDPDGMMSPGWDSVNVPTYGFLYTWNAAVRNVPMQMESQRIQGICPAGWHIPGKTEWQTLFDYVKSQPKWVNGKSKSSIAKALSAQEKWDEGLGIYPNCFVCKNLSANNGTGFSALPAGYYGGDYESMTASAYFWASTCGKFGDGQMGPYSVSWGYDKSTVNMSPWVTGVGCSVRCVKD